MSGLARRVGSLERCAEEERRRELRRLVEAMARKEGFAPAEVEEAYQLTLDAQAEIAALRRAGRSEREIVQQMADELGTSADKLMAEATAYFEAVCCPPGGTR